MSRHTFQGLALLMVVVLGMPSSISAKDPASQIPRLVEELQSGNAKTRMQAAMKLGNAGPEAESAIASLEKAIANDPDDRVRHWAKQAAKKIRTAIALASGLDQPDVLRFYPVQQSRAEGGLTMGATGIVQMYLEGERSAIGINNKNQITLHGMLAISLRKNYQPKIGAGHEIIASTKPIEGRFRYYNLPDLSADRTWRIHYDNLANHDDLDGDGRHDVTLVVVPIAEAGLPEDVDQEARHAYKFFAAHYEWHAATNAARAKSYRERGNQDDRQARESETRAKSYDFWGIEAAKLGRRLRTRLSAKQFLPHPEG